MALFEGTAIWVSETIVDFECTYSIPLLELCSRNKIDIDMRVGWQAYMLHIQQCNNNKTMHWHLLLILKYF